MLMIYCSKYCCDTYIFCSNFNNIVNNTVDNTVNSTAVNNTVNTVNSGHKYRYVANDDDIVTSALVFHKIKR